MLLICSIYNKKIITYNRRFYNELKNFFLPEPCKRILNSLATVCCWISSAALQFKSLLCKLRTLRTNRSVKPEA